MPIPDYQTLMLPLLKLLADNNEHSLSELSNKLSVEFNLTPEEINETLPTGGKKFHNRVQWARAYLFKSGLLETPSRAVYKITKEGKKVLDQSPDKIDNKFLEQFDGYWSFKGATGTKKGKAKKQPVTTEESSLTPEEVFAGAFEEIENKLREDILTMVMDSSPSFFENLIMDILKKMGYGPYEAKVTSPSHDGGIDGIIPQDELGLDNVYIQAKKWKDNVTREAVQQFVGALDGLKTNKGIFATTSKFSKGAIEYVGKANKRIVLIDGEKLTKLMVTHNVGVKIQTSFLVKAIDPNYFIEE